MRKRPPKLLLPLEQRMEVSIQGMDLGMSISMGIWAGIVRIRVGRGLGLEGGDSSLGLENRLGSRKLLGQTMIGDEEWMMRKRASCIDSSLAIVAEFYWLQPFGISTPTGCKSLVV